MGGLKTRADAIPPNVETLSDPPPFLLLCQKGGDRIAVFICAINT